MRDGAVRLDEHTLFTAQEQRQEHPDQFDTQAEIDRILKRREERKKLAAEAWARLEQKLTETPVDPEELKIAKDLIQVYYAGSTSDAGAKENFMGNIVLNGHFVSSDTPGVGKMIAEVLPNVMPSAKELNRYYQENKLRLLPFFKNESDQKLTEFEIASENLRKKEELEKLKEQRKELAQKAWVKLLSTFIKNEVDPNQQKIAQNLVLIDYGESMNDASAKETFMTNILLNQLAISAETAGIGSEIAKVLPDIMPTRAELEDYLEQQRI